MSICFSLCWEQQIKFYKALFQPLHLPPPPPHPQQQLTKWVVYSDTFGVLERPVCIEAESSQDAISFVANRFGKNANFLKAERQNISCRLLKRRY